MPQPDNVTPQTTGGAFTGAAPAAAGTSLYTGAGRLCRIAITASGTGAITVRDSIVSASGTVLFSWPAAGGFPTTVASLLSEMPFANGLYVDTTAGTGACTVSYNKSGIAGGAP